MNTLYQLIVVAFTVFPFWSIFSCLSAQLLTIQASTGLLFLSQDSDHRTWFHLPFVSPQRNIARFTKPAASWLNPLEPPINRLAHWSPKIIVPADFAPAF